MHPELESALAKELSQASLTHPHLSAADLYELSLARVQAQCRQDTDEWMDFISRPVVPAERIDQLEDVLNDMEKDDEE